MSEMIERVARAIAISDRCDPDKLAKSDPHLMMKSYRQYARAAIEAMRGPITQEMGLAFTRYWHDNFRDDHVFEDTPAQECWEGMIDAALQAPAGAG